jgi:hypothetical protein
MLAKSGSQNDGADLWGENAEQRYYETLFTRKIQNPLFLTSIILHRSASVGSTLVARQAGR